MKILEIFTNKKVLVGSVIALLVLGITSTSLAVYFYSEYESYECTSTDSTLAFNSDVEVVNVSNTEEEVEEAEEVVMFTVEVKGAVANPGVYTIAEGSVINDLITLAGGFTSKAYTNNINLSKKVSDEMVVYVFTKTEISNSKSSTTCDCSTSSTETKEETESITESTIEEAQTTCTTKTIYIDTCTDAYSSVIETEDGSTQSSDSTTSSSSSATTESKTSLVNINTATVSELTSLSGIGDSKAQAIISYREENGAFASIEDIKNVSGIGDSIYEKIKDYITV